MDILNMMTEKNIDSVDVLSHNEVAEYMERCNEWRRGADIEMPNPVALGLVIDRAVQLLRGIEGENNG